MFDNAFFITALIGSVIAGIWDLKTTEVPDWIPVIMIIIGIALYGYQAYLYNDISVFKSPIIYFLLFSSIGWPMFFLGQWGGGDAEMLSAMGFLLPGFFNQTKIFYYIANVFVVGSLYILGYAFVFSLNNKKIKIKFKKDITKNLKVMLIISLMFSVFVSILFYYFSLDLIHTSAIAAVSFSLMMFLFIVWYFAKSVETVGFRKRIPISKLKVGDVLLKSKKWVGITKKEIMKLKKSGKKYVWIKEGVRFTPTFSIALLITKYFGFVLML